MALWNEPNIELECQSVRSLLCFWPLTASTTLQVKKKPCPCQNPKNFEQIYQMYGLAMMIVVSTSTPIKNIDKMLDA